MRLVGYLKRNPRSVRLRWGWAVTHGAPAPRDLCDRTYMAFFTHVTYQIIKTCWNMSVVINILFSNNAVVHVITGYRPSSVLIPSVVTRFK